MGGSDQEVQLLREDVTEIKGDVKNVHCAITELRVLIAGNYVTKTEFNEHKADEKNSRRWWAGFIIAAVGVFITLVNVFWKK